MLFEYSLTESTVFDELSGPHITYGIEISDQLGRIINSVPDIFFDRETALAFIEKCNSGCLSPVHVFDVIENEPDRDSF